MAPSLHRPFSEFIEFRVPGHRGKLHILYALSEKEKDEALGEHGSPVASVAFGCLTHGVAGIKVPSSVPAKSISLSDR